MTDKTVLDHISELVAEEHRLLDLASHTPLTEEQHAQLKALQVQLDQFWDLLRQRRARREFGENPDAAKPRDPSIVEHFQQ